MIDLILLIAAVAPFVGLVCVEIGHARDARRGRR
jgi:hypothetical protein